MTGKGDEMAPGHVPSLLLVGHLCTAFGTLLRALSDELDASAVEFGVVAISQSDRRFALTVRPLPKRTVLLPPDDDENPHLPPDAVERDAP